MVGLHFGLVVAFFLLVPLISVSAESGDSNAAPLDKFWAGWEPVKDVVSEEYEKQSSGTPPADILAGRMTPDRLLEGTGLLLIGLGAVALIAILLINPGRKKPSEKGTVPARQDKEYEYCVECGARMDRTAKFCAGCGKSPGGLKK